MSTRSKNLARKKNAPLVLNYNTRKTDFPAFLLNLEKHKKVQCDKKKFPCMENLKFISSDM